MKLYFILFISLLCVLSGIAQPVQKYRRICELSQIWRDVSENFYNPAFLKQINWDSIYCDHLKQIEDLKNDRAYYLLLQELLAKLNDAHSELLSFDSFMAGEKTAAFLPIDIIWIDNKVYISAIAKELSDKIPLGSQILEIEGEESESYFQKHIFPYISSNTEHYRRYKSSSLFMLGSKGDSLAITIKTAEKEPRKVHVTYCPADKFRNQSFAKLKGVHDKRTDSYIVKEGTGNYYYLRVDQFSNALNVKELMTAVYTESKDCEYVVLDLRNNSGGNELKADSLLMSFLDIDSLSTYKSVTRSQNAFYAAMGLGNSRYKSYYENMHLDTLPENVLKKEGLPCIGKPLYILIGGKTISAAEDLLITLKLHYPRRAVLVGSATAGSTGAPLVRRLSKDLTYRICTRQPLVGEDLFRNGIQPDYRHNETIEDYLNEKDQIFSFLNHLYREKNEGE